MRILAHRGHWSEGATPNGLAAFERAFERGWGVELDVRDLDGTLVVSHDPPRRGVPTLTEVLEARGAAGAAGVLAVNVKADGLQALVAAELADAAPDTWFAFDMSVPDALGYARRALPLFTRHSDLEPEPALYDDAVGVWLDDLGGGWLAGEHAARHLAAGKSVAIVSPELHGRPHREAWRRWADWDFWADPRVLLCTDHPREAEEVFA